MKLKIVLWIIGMILSIPVALAQTGLFTQASGNSMVNFGITVLVVFIVADVIRRRFRKQK